MTMPCTTRTLARQARPSRSTSFPGAATVAALVLFLGLSATTCVAATTSGVRVSQSRREASRSGPSADAEQAPRARDPARIATLVPLVGARTPNTATRVAEPRKPVSFDSNEGASLSFDEVPSSFIYDNAAARSSPIQARIINGDEVNPPGLYPWMVAIVGVRVTAGQETESFWCGGTIISPGYVMSASHCFFSNAGSENTNFAFFRVKVGAHDINDPEIMNVDVDEILGHPKYAGATFENDVAILRLATSLDPVKYPPARLSWQIEDYRQGANTIVMGWGKNENNNLNQKLHQASVPTVSLETCTSAGSYPGPPETTLTVKDTMLCAGVLAGGLDACQGDSGGPLLAVDASTGELRQTGIVSWGEGCAKPGKYGVYANVMALRGFIIRKVPDIQRYSPLPDGVTIQDFLGPEPAPVPPPAPSFGMLAGLTSLTA